MPIARTVSLIAIVAALAATTISYKLLRKHLTGASGSAWFDAGCGEGVAGSRVNCAAVLASPHSYFPPSYGDSVNLRQHIPVAWFGLAYYSVLSVWMVGVGRPSRSRRWLTLAPLALVSMGLFASGRLTYIMSVSLKEWCPWCAVTHFLNAVIAVCLILMLVRPGSASADTGSPRPARRVLGMTIFAALAVAATEREMLGKAIFARESVSNKQSFEQCEAVVNRIKANTDVLLQLWRSAKSCDIELRNDDPARIRDDDGKPPFAVVVFSDFECPSCNRFADFLDREVDRLFGGHLKVVFKHYPMDQSCNSRTASTMHPRACEAALFAEALRLTGGNEHFWHGHDHLFSRQSKWKTQGVHALGEISSLPEAQLDAAQDAMNSRRDELLGRIQRDIEQATDCGIAGTPAVFVKGRPVDTLAKTEIAFWDRLADEYWQERGEPRPEATKLSVRQPSKAP